MAGAEWEGEGMTLYNVGTCAALVTFEVRRTEGPRRWWEPIIMQVYIAPMNDLHVELCGGVDIGKGIRITMTPKKAKVRLV